MKAINQIFVISTLVMLIHFSQANASWGCQLTNGYELPKGVELYTFCSFDSNIAPAYKHVTNKYGAVNRQGEIVINFEYDSQVKFWEGKALVKKDDKWFIINTQNQVISEYDFEDAYSFDNQGIAQIKKNSKWGFMRADGNVFIKPQFDNILRGFSGLSLDDDSTKNIAMFEVDGKQGLVNVDGKIIVPAEYNDVRPQDEIILVMNDAKAGFYDYKGNVLYPVVFERTDGFYTSGKWTKENWLPLEKDGKFGAINKYGRLVVPIEFDGVNLISNNSFSVSKNGKSGIYANNQLVYPFEFDEIGEYSEGFLLVKKDKKWGYLDSFDSLMMVDYNKVQDFSEGMAGIAKQLKDSKQLKWGYIDQLGNEIIEPKYDIVTPFYQGLASVTYADKVGVIDFEGHTIVPFEYDSISKFENGYAIIAKKEPSTDDSKDGIKKYGIEKDSTKKDNLKFGIINTQGEIVVNIEYEQITKVGEGMLGVKKNGKWGLANQQGELIFPYQLGQLFDTFEEGEIQVTNCYDENKYDISCYSENTYNESMTINKQGKVLRRLWSSKGGFTEEGFKVTGEASSE